MKSMGRAPALMVANEVIGIEHGVGLDILQAGRVPRRRSFRRTSRRSPPEGCQSLSAVAGSHRSWVNIVGLQSTMVRSASSNGGGGGQSILSSMLRKLGRLGNSSLSWPTIQTLSPVRPVDCKYLPVTVLGLSFTPLWRI